MSYQDVASGRELRPYSPSDSSEKFARTVAASIFKIQTEVSRLKHDVDKLGGLRDTLALRQQIGAANTRVTALAKDVKDKLLQLGAVGVSPKQATKLTADFEATLKDFQVTIKAAKQREAASLPLAPPPEAVDVGVGASSRQGDDDIEQRTLLAQQRKHELKKLDSEIDYNEALIEERDAGIQEIQHQIVEVNEIFQDLAVLVHDQGAMIDDIEANISTVAERSKEGRKEIVRAERYQRTGRNRKCFLMLMAAVVLGVLLIVLLGT